MRTKVLATVLTAAALACVSSALANEFDYSSTSGADIIFNGNSTFDFTPATSSFDITGSPSALANGLLGEIGGVFTIGSITTVGSISSAPVTGIGTFEIDDGTGHALIGSLNWVDITQIGSGGLLDINAVANLTGVTYSGSNPDLLLIKAQDPLSDTLSFSFVPAVALSTLKNGPGTSQTGFSGAINAVPDGGATLVLLGGAISALGLFRSKTGKLK